MVCIDKNTRHVVLSSSLFLIFFLSGCNNDLLVASAKIPTENVMSKGDRIVASNDSGTLTITAGEGNKRYITVSGKEKFLKASYTWLSDTVCVKLTERKARYRGSLGLYCKANVKKIRQKDVNRGPTRLIMEEAQLHFDTLEAAKEWLGIVKFDKGFNRHVWSSDGLYVRWSHVVPEYWFFPKPAILHVLIFQIYIGGNQLSPYQSDDGFRFWYGGSVFYHPELLSKLDKEPVKIGGHKPTNLQGALDNRIKVEHLTDEQLRKFKESLKR